MRFLRRLVLFTVGYGLVWRIYERVCPLSIGMKEERR